MSDFNAAQVLAEAYTLYKKHYDGMGLDFKIAIAQVREESEQCGKEQGWDEAITAQIQRLISGDPDVERFQMPANPYRTDRLEGDDETH